MYEKNSANNLKSSINHRFSLLHDKASDEKIEQRIRDGVELSGATPWILMFAILIASVGLNINSTAVIIGAMLISPLMGSIMGIGLGLALYDFDLFKRSIWNLLLSTIISLTVSTLYFSITPLQEAQSELLARTTPTIWDVLIALFGGVAGIIGATRREKSNVIPGVAIATALMPPVCTAGFGFATQRWDFVGGAMYLYAINCVFIAIATIIVIRALQMKTHKFADKKVEIRVKFCLFMLALLTALPSAYLATKLVREEVFKTNAKNFIKQEFIFETTHVAQSAIDAKNKIIELSLIGQPIGKYTLETIQKRLVNANLENTKIIVHQMHDNKIDVTALKSTLLSDLYKDTQQIIIQKDEQIKKLTQELNLRNELFAKSEDIEKEIKAQYPNIHTVFLSEGIEIKQNNKIHLLSLNLKTNKKININEEKRIENWFRVRIKNDTARVNIEYEALKKDTN